MSKLWIIGALVLGGCTAEDRQFMSNLGSAMEGAGASLQGQQSYGVTPVQPVVSQQQVYNCQRWRNGDVSCMPR